MKINKKTIKSAETLDNLDPVLAPNTCPYDECITHIHEAIDCLAGCAQDNPIAKEAIANLSVVLLDLQQ